ncbi:MAG: hypothetical protein ACREV1_00190 [Gammaproteobacteria bacterium]
MKTSNSVLSAVVVSVLGLSATLNAPQALSQYSTSTAELSDPSLPVHPGAVEISIFGIGPPVDRRAVNKVRRTVGAGIATGVTDTYFVRGYGIEGGFSACAQKSPFASQTDFIAFVDRLRGITPDPTTTSYSVGLTVSCDEPVFCTTDVKICPDGSALPRVPPTCEFAACPGE